MESVKVGDRTSLGDRMKTYEAVSGISICHRIPVIVRIDGRAFHTYTRKFGKKYSHEFNETMALVGLAVQEDMQGCELAYGQSDEISFLLTDYKTIQTQGWFGYDLRKMISISASIASSKFTKITGDTVAFDSRAFSIPQDEVCNYFIWRQQDATRNAIQFAGREYFSDKELYKKSCSNIQEMLFTKQGINFNDYHPIRKRGYCIAKGTIDTNIPIFTTNRDYVEKYVNVRED